jgi:hypothetical protein
MSSFPILDVAIGLAFVYLLLALICTTLMEWIAQRMRLRGTMLEQATQRLLGEQGQPDRPVTDAYLQHPLIHTLGDGKRKPSYVPAKLFAKALRDVLSQPREGAGKPPASDRLKHALRALAESDAAKGGRDHLPNEQTLADWYDHFMERVSGTYKRRTRVITFWLAVGLTLALNADTIKLTTNLWQDPTLRAYVVEQARARLAQGPPLETVEYTEPDNPEPTPPIAPDTTASSNRVLPEEASLLSQLFGWTGESASLARAQAEWRGKFNGSAVWALSHLIGWLLTALAVSLGAPFWFDTLNRFMSLRSSGNPAPKKPTSTAETRP